MGQMGHYYAPVLVRDLGFDPESIVMYDIDFNKMVFVEDEVKKAPGLVGIRRATSLQEALDGATVAFNLTNSNSHLQILQAMAKAGVQHVFSEKPLVPPAHLHKFQDFDWGSMVITVGHLINFSGAISEMMKRVDEEDLYAVHCAVEWGKPRFGIHTEKPTGPNARPTAGVVADEMCHGLEVFDYVVRNGGTIGDLELTAKVRRLPFANQLVQHRAQEIDPSFELDPPSSVTLELNALVGVGRFALLDLRSSFMRPNQEREIYFTFYRRGKEIPAYQGRLLFDVDGKDILEWSQIGQKPEIITSDVNKLTTMMNAYFDKVLKGANDLRLTPMDLAVRGVQIADAAMRSVRNNTPIKLNYIIV